MPELLLALFAAGVLIVADPERLQMIIERIRELAAWLAE
jgi:hypothetical protein